MHKYNDDAKIARVHKRIREENARRKTVGRLLLFLTSMNLLWKFSNQILLNNPYLFFLRYLKNPGFKLHAASQQTGNSELPYDRYDSELTELENPNSVQQMKQFLLLIR
jgi:hypothetical protein